MGGGHHEPFKIPNYKIYQNWQQFPQLLAHSQRLEKLGLKDPWIRNYTFMFDKDFPYVRGKWAHFKMLFKPGFNLGVGVAAAIIVVEELHSYTKTGETSWSAHH